jgi:ankyrin repeat protein
VDEGLYRAFKEATKEGKSIVNIQDNQGNTPFHIALLQFIADEQKDYSVLSALMNEKLPATIDISLKNEDGDTILDLVSRLSSPEIIDRLKEQSACISRGYSK